MRHASNASFRSCPKRLNDDFLQPVTFREAFLDPLALDRSQGLRDDRAGLPARLFAAFRSGVDTWHSMEEAFGRHLGELNMAMEIKSTETIKQAVMAGNSMRSDVLPALDAGCWGALIPYPLVWAHEAADAPEDHERYVELESISELPAWVDSVA